jgi:hypothetical protein
MIKNMKTNHSTAMKNIRKTLGLILMGIWMQPVIAQEASTPATEPEAATVTPVKNTFENSVQINNQTTQVNAKNELGFMIQHRFGVIKDGYDLYGIYAPANIRLGLTYGITKDFTVGLGVTKARMQYDLEWKYKILQQSKGGGSPITLTYYGDIARSEAASSKFKNQVGELVESNRLTFYHEIMASYKLNSHFSFQASVFYAHLNIVDSALLTHDRIGYSIIGRYKFSPQSSVLIGFNSNMVSLDKNLSPFTNTKDPLKPDFSIGYEVSTGSHQFQIFIAAADAILNQDVRFSNQNDFFNKQILFGFNITRQWGF